MLFAAGKLEAWAIPVNPRLSARELDLIASHSGARRVVFNAALSNEAADAYAPAPKQRSAPSARLAASASGALNETARTRTCREPQ